MADKYYSNNIINAFNALDAQSKSRIIDLTVCKTEEELQCTYCRSHGIDIKRTWKFTDKFHADSVNESTVRYLALKHINDARYKVVVNREADYIMNKLKTRTVDLQTVHSIEFEVEQKCCSSLHFVALLDNNDNIIVIIECPKTPTYELGLKEELLKRMKGNLYVEPGTYVNMDTVASAPQVEGELETY